MNDSRTHVAVVGAGLGGLAAALLLARDGRAVTLIDRAGHAGGRARSTCTEAPGGGTFIRNLGPHAVYRAGAAARVLRALGVAVTGGSPSHGGYALARGALHTLPLGPVSLVTTDLVDLADKLEFVRLARQLVRADTPALAQTTIGAWLDDVVRRPGARPLFEALLRVANYGLVHHRHSAGAVLAQAAMAIKSNVTFPDGGWQSLVDALEEKARAAGVVFALGVPAASLERDARVRGVTLADGRRVLADAVVVAGSPHLAHALLGADDAPSRAWLAAATPVRAASLDVALTAMPRARALFALGLEQPLYVSAHSAFARLAPDGGAVVHAARYLAPDEHADASTERELETLLDALQPGWRDVCSARRFLPDLTVSHWLPEARTRGLAGRPAVRVAHVPGLYLAGDWVGDEGQLCDASLASAEHAARLIRSADHEAARAA